MIIDTFFRCLFYAKNQEVFQILKVIDLKNNHYPANAAVNRKTAVNGERTLSLSFLLDEMNADFLADLGTRWGVEFDKERYTLINPSVEAIVQQKSISAVLQFFIDLGGHYLQDEAENESRTALNAYTELSQGTGYTFHLVDSFPATTLSYQKNMSKTERFHYYNKRYGVEFIVSGTNVYLYRKIGSHRPEVRIDEDLNVKDATVEIDDANFFTWCKCYYDKIDDTEGGAEEYRHEVVYADQGLIDKYGEIEGPAIYQGSIKDKQVMLDFAKSTQEESIVVSHSVTLADLRRQGYDEFIFRAGDTIRLSLSSINTTVDIRIMEIDETFDVNGELTGLTLTLGNYNPVDAYKNNRDAVLLDLEDWHAGRKSIPNFMLEDSIQRASDIVIGDTDSVMTYRKDRMTGHHSKNLGNNITVNTNGVVLYRNFEPKTAITYEGVVAETIVGGSIIGVNLSSIDESGRFHVNGSDAEFHDDTTGRAVSLSPDGLYGWNALGDVRFQADSILVTSSAFGTSNHNAYLAPKADGEARVVTFADVPSDGLVDSYNYQPLRASGFFGNYLNTNPAAPYNHMYIRTLSGMEVRLTRNETTDDYTDLRAAGIYANHLTNNTSAGESSNLFIRPASGGEVRATVGSSTSTYAPVRAKGFFGEFLDRTASTSGQHLYVRPGGDPGELRVTVRDTTDVYQPVRAKDFITDSSDRSQKKNIEVYDLSTLDTFRNMDVYLYNRNTDKDDARKQLGAMIDELPEVTHSASGDSFALYAYASYIAKGLKDVIDVMDDQGSRIKKLEGTA